MAAICDKYTISYDALKRLVTQLAAKNGGEYKPIERPKSGIHKTENGDDKNKKIQRHLLTWISDEQIIYKAIKPYISVDDFMDEIYHKVAEKLFEQLEENRLNPGAIVSMFEDENEQAEVAAIFNTPLERVTERAEKERALADLVYQVKKSSCDAFASKPNLTLEEMMQDIENRKALEKLKKVQFHLSE